ncbi:hypothetical protein DHEL01_v211343 [Diaporthe helianthi]|uniref:Dihydroneopterin aldolase/epimerase domain-containing protein n=1 Tax=Diaporthe helianthi TaxID=158607 RepID=A0A2P5HJ44_DIAHE|nr:hypothetical protein DHEL01_v211343 [Diaporthe helianthi]
MSLRSSWTVRHAAGEPLAVVRVRSLQTTVVGPQDAWGRAKLQQPLLVSAELHFLRPFGAAVSADNVTSGDTVHYGELSKLILACVDRSNDHASLEGAPTIDLRVLLEMIWIVLTGRNIDGTDAEPEAVPLLDGSRLRFISLTVSLPKASLLGEAVSLTASNVYAPFTVGPSALSMYGLCLKLHRIRVPTLIGVNNNERQAKQFVVVDVEVDKLDYYPDIYCELEKIVVQSLERSSFETLEALGAHLTSTIVRDFKPKPAELFTGEEGWQVKVSMEKPTAVPFADCPVVEVRASAAVMNGTRSHR